MPFSRSSNAKVLPYIKMMLMVKDEVNIDLY